MKSSALKLIAAMSGMGILAGASLHGASLTFSNASFIAINDSLTPPTKASPYPSLLSVAGPTNQVVKKMTVTLYGFSHTFPSDVTILLVGPEGQRSILMSEVGGLAAYSVTNLTLTLDDDATNPLPLDSILYSGSFRPNARHVPLDFALPPPAPINNSNSPCGLYVFKGADPTGTWNLFVVDDGAGDAGSISNGWSMSIAFGVPLQITRVQTNVVLSWPSTVTNCSLQSVPSLTSTAWSNVTAVPIQASGRFYVTNAILGSSRFFRLLQQ